MLTVADRTDSIRSGRNSAPTRNPGCPAPTGAKGPVIVTIAMPRPGHTALPMRLVRSAMPAVTTTAAEAAAVEAAAMETTVETAMMEAMMVKEAKPEADPYWNTVFVIRV